MKRIALIAAFLAVISHSIPACAQAPAQAQMPSGAGEDARLREALRNAIGQARALEDERNRLQARVTKAEADATKLKADNTDLSAKLKESRDKRKEERELFEKLLIERDETLEKWKSAYEEAANVARAKESERAKLDAEVKTLTPALEASRKRNAELQEIAREILRKYEDFGLREALSRAEPVFGLGKVRAESNAQEYRNKVLDRKEIPASEN
jgi:chromosome segregation ATPase